MSLDNPSPHNSHHRTLERDGYERWTAGVRVQADRPAENNVFDAETRAPRRVRAKGAKGDNPDANYKTSLSREGLVVASELSPSSGRLRPTTRRVAAEPSYAARREMRISSAPLCLCVETANVTAHAIPPASTLSGPANSRIRAYVRRQRDQDRRRPSGPLEPRPLSTSSARFLSATVRADRMCPATGRRPVEA
jgi:hypothetical protein